MSKFVGKFKNSNGEIVTRLDTILDIAHNCLVIIYCNQYGQRLYMGESQFNLEFTRIKDRRFMICSIDVNRKKHFSEIVLQVAREHEAWEAALRKARTLTYPRKILSIEEMDL